jgi:hypothetical protein
MIGLMLAILATGLGQDLPWSQDVTATRDAALRDKSPCVLLLNSDAKAY